MLCLLDGMTMCTLWVPSEIKLVDTTTILTYTLYNMKKLQKEFTANYDKVGNNKFIQLRKENGVAMYERQNMDGSHRSYEVFIVKVVEKGTPLPGGNKVQETYEQYPGCAAFGKTAFDCKTIDRAESRFAELVEKVKASTEAKEEAEKTGKPVRRGRKANPKSATVKVPSGKFTMKMLINEYQLPQPTLYLIVKQWITEAKVAVVDSIRNESGRGKPALVYQAL